MNHLLIISVIFMLFTIVLSQKWTCDRSAERKVDNLMAKIMTYGNSGRRYPTNKKEMDSYCDEHYRLITQVEGFKDQCLKGLNKQTISLILFAMKNLINQYCKKNSKKVDELLSAAPCANAASNEFNKCNSQYIDALLAAQNIRDNKLKFPYACCAYNKVFECLHTRGQKVKGCTDKALDICEDYIKSHFENVLKLMCADYLDQNDKCDAITVKPKKGKNQRRTKSFILPFIKLLQGLPEL